MAGGDTVSGWPRATRTDSGIPCRGQRIAKWEELIALTQKMALRLPGMA